ncbi:MAG TPA: pyruvate kinase [Syntrophorhabdaceae bacterium]|mgnify:FL=1|jgi:pyruvate kinase|nr:pyruvate kinase [Syntrophorhabdaceae bacterium]HOF58756.1 pyruvate kinase [Syntrophorhabdaceae bacterium]HOS06299.1 pyruvate kinase [Syntrophorhabdaceae bacterium]HPL42053.1 pyruvate kinase [Syntrophorhabdaceae bacterium]HPN98821.1 pyruvate kinase [Syntrophorhabdaceae bacterium]
MRKAKIVCTIGPVTGSERQIEALIAAGMDVARLNFSHGNHASHEEMICRIRKASKKLKKQVAILQDLQGIKIRVGRLKGEKVRLEKGADVTIMKGDEKGDGKIIFIDYPWLIDDAKVGDIILLDDGLMKLKVTKKDQDSLGAIVIEGGILKENKGVNLPHMKISAPFFTEKDKRDLEFGLKMGVDYVALSFVRTSVDVKAVKKWLIKKGANIPLIAKIEKEEAILNIDGILAEVDGIMVARGDLGVELPLEEVPVYQKMLIQKANAAGRIVITATQMLESMTQHSRPTRAESTDVANAVIDGTDALMLSAETSAGKYPIEAVNVMNRIISYTEQAYTRPFDSSFADAGQGDLEYPIGKTTKENYLSDTAAGYELPKAIAHAASRAAEETGSKSIVAFTKTGFTAHLISKFRPSKPIIALSPDEKVVRQMSIYWGVIPFLIKYMENTDELIREVGRYMMLIGKAAPGDRVVIVASLPPSLSGKTNFMKIHEIIQ